MSRSARAGYSLCECHEAPGLRPLESPQTSRTDLPPAWRIWPFCGHLRPRGPSPGWIQQHHQDCDGILLPASYVTGSWFPLPREGSGWQKRLCPRQIAPTYLLPSLQSPGTLHFPGVSSFVAFSSSQLEDPLEEDATRPAPPLGYRLALLGSPETR